MVNSRFTPDTPTAGPGDRRERARPGMSAVGAGLLGQTKLNPFGDLHTVQHLSARLARALRGVFEPLLRRELRCWAEPLAVQHFGDYRAERAQGLTAWLPLPMTTLDGQALCVLDGRFVLELLDLFFGGSGSTPPTLPTEFSPAAEAMIARLGATIVGPLAAAWEPLARIDFAVGRVEANPAMLGIGPEDALIVTRFGLATEGGEPVHLDLLYPVAAMKPHGASLAGRVLDKVEPDPAWRTALTRAAMNVRFPVRSVLAEPVVPLSLLMNLKAGDVIPISFGANVPVMVGGDRLGVGTVGVSNGLAAVRLTSLSNDAHPAEGPCDE
ncbi:flagellar motor switch protein FliM [Sphingomonas sp.]|jgi:flagellar motor switch protein FliM|uniref:flagellar motor switch protein FliM n=1 Tax=Sphingomonas sp. TaxID=28214 RepID=UPI0039C9D092